MADDVARTCVECQGSMFPITIMDKSHPGPTKHRHTGSLEYRMPEDRLSFWTGKFPTAGMVQAVIARAAAGSPCMAAGRTPEPALQRKGRIPTAGFFTRVFSKKMDLGRRCVTM